MTDAPLFHETSEVPLDAVQRDLEVTVRELVFIGRSLHDRAQGATYPLDVPKSRERYQQVLALCADLLGHLARAAESPAGRQLTLEV